MTSAAAFRWSRFINAASGRAIIVPIDHGLTAGPLDGLNAMAEARGWIDHPAIGGVIAHKGFAGKLIAERLLGGKGLCVHLNGAPSLATGSAAKPLLTSLDAALRAGADAVSLDLVFDGDSDRANLAMAGNITDAAASMQVPVVAMVKSAHPTAPRERAKLLRQLARAMAELGVTAVKLPRPAALDDLPVLMDGVSRDIDILFAGGERDSESALIEMVGQALRLGARGVCIGRNVFQHPQPKLLLDRLSAAVHGRPQASIAVARPA